MRGSCHNLIVDSLRATARRFGAGTQAEVPVRPRDGRIGYIDLVVDAVSTIAAIEVELTPDRVRNDAPKALALPADVLWIVTPEPRVARLVVARLGFTSRQGRFEGLPVSVFTFGQAQRRLGRLLQPQPLTGVQHHAT